MKRVFSDAEIAAATYFSWSTGMARMQAQAPIPMKEIPFDDFFVAQDGVSHRISIGNFHKARCGLSLRTGSAPEYAAKVVDALTCLGCIAHG